MRAGYLIITALSIGLMGCVTKANKEMFYNEVVVQNHTLYEVVDVTIKVKNEYNIFKCSYIPPQAECSNKFKKTRYRGNQIVISWRYKDKTITTNAFTLDVPGDFDSTIPMSGILEIIDGDIRPYFDQSRNRLRSKKSQIIY